MTNGRVVLSNWTQMTMKILPLRIYDTLPRDKIMKYLGEKCLQYTLVTRANTTQCLTKRRLKVTFYLCNRRYTLSTKTSGSTRTSRVLYSPAIDSQFWTHSSKLAHSIVPCVAGIARAVHTVQLNLPQGRFPRTGSKIKRRNSQG